MQLKLGGEVFQWKKKLLSIMHRKLQYQVHQRENTTLVLHIDLVYVLGCLEIYFSAPSY